MPAGLKSTPPLPSLFPWQVGARWWLRVPLPRGAAVAEKPPPLTLPLGTSPFPEPDARGGGVSASASSPTSGPYTSSPSSGPSSSRGPLFLVCVEADGPTRVLRVIDTERHPPWSLGIGAATATPSAAATAAAAAAAAVAGFAGGLPGGRENIAGAGVHSHDASRALTAHPLSVGVHGSGPALTAAAAPTITTMSASVASSPQEQQPGVELQVSLSALGLSVVSPEQELVYMCLSGLGLQLQLSQVQVRAAKRKGFGFGVGWATCVAGAQLGATSLCRCYDYGHVCLWCCPVSQAHVCFAPLQFPLLPI